MFRIDIDKELRSFRVHLELNKRTILSAKFGDGKTTFLDEFRQKYNDELFVVTIRPVNYSVAKNEDIFEYIKYDILLQLASTNHVPDIDTKTVWDIVKNNVFTLGNLDTAVDFAIDCLPGANSLRRVKDTIIKTASDFEVKDAFDQYQEGRKTLDKYQSVFQSQIGGLYEQDGYTLLIKEILKSLKVPSVLVIDDLDRMDPGHLFRILNVFAAHIDQDEKTNKFGFSNIILVLDYDVTGKIFHHFYGPDANYEGYMSKFIDHGIFKFSINEAAHNEFDKYLTEECLLPEKFNANLGPYNTMRKVFSELSVRDIIHVLDSIDMQYFDSHITLRSGSRISTAQPIVKFLSVIRRLNDRLPEEPIMSQLVHDSCIVNMLGEYLFNCPEIEIGAPFQYNYTLWNRDISKEFQHPTFKSFSTQGIQIQIIGEQEVKKAYKLSRDYVFANS